MGHRDYRDQTQAMPFSKRRKSPENLRVTLTEKPTFETYEKGKGQDPQDVPWAVSPFEERATVC
jgi:hypothetical protein